MTLRQFKIHYIQSRRNDIQISRHERTFQILINYFGPDIQISKLDHNRINTFKNDLYESVILDITEDLRHQLREVEAVIHGKPLSIRMDLSIDMMTDYLFEYPEISNLILSRYFAKTRNLTANDFRVPEFISRIALSMNLCDDKKNVLPRVKMQVLAIMNSIHNFVSGENFFRPMLGLEREEYRPLVKETLKFILIPAFSKHPEADEIRDGKN